MTSLRITERIGLWREHSRLVKPVPSFFHRRDGRVEEEEEGGSGSHKNPSSFLTNHKRCGGEKKDEEEDLILVVDVEGPCESGGKEEQITNHQSTTTMSSSPTTQKENEVPLNSLGLAAKLVLPPEHWLRFFSSAAAVEHRGFDPSLLINYTLISVWIF